MPFFLPLWLSSNLLASNSTPPAEPVVVTVSAAAIPVSATSASVTVIDREEIENSHAETVAQLLRDAPFLHISQTGGIGGLTTVSLRGGDPNFTVVMIDGVPVNDPTNILGGSFDFSQLSSDNIERIEIVRGPLSSVYGSEAISGVINIISRRGQKSRLLDLQAFYGSFNSRDVRGATRGQWKSLNYSLAASYFDIGQQVENDSSSLGTVSLTSNIAFAKNKSLLFNFRFEDNSKSSFPENGGGPEFSILRDPKKVDASDFVFATEYQHAINSALNFNASLDYFDHQESSNAPAILDAVPPTERSQPPFSSDTNFDRTRFRLTGNYKMQDLTTIVGIGVREERGTNNTLIAESFPSRFSLDRTTYSYSAEALYGRGKLNANLGIRFDDPDQFGLETSPRFGFSYLFFRSGTRLRASWGKGFKLPSFFALGEPNIGNPALRPERSRGFDMAIEQQLWATPAVLSIGYFYNSFRDLIDFSTEEFRLVNRSFAIARGIEIESRFQLPESINFGAHLDYLNEHLLHTDEPLRDRPRWRGGFDFKWTYREVLHLSVNFLSVGNRFDFQVPVPAKTIAPGYQLVNAVVDYRLRSGLILYGRVDNVLDNHYHEFIGFPNPGRYLRIGLMFQVKP